MTVREAVMESSAALAAAGVDNPSLDASLLLAETLNTSRPSLIAAASNPVDETSLTAFRALVKRRLAGECVAYILGRKEFYGLEFLVGPSVLVPRPDTEILVEAAVKELGMRNDELGIRVLDLCTGSGAVAVALKHSMPELEVWATDISAEALEVAQANAARLLPEGAIHFCQGNLFECFLPFFRAETQRRKGAEEKNDTIRMNASFHLIVSNPPYIPSTEIGGLSPEVRNEPVLALDGGSDGMDLIRSIISQSPEFLCSNGILLLEADPRQMDSIALLLEKKGFANVQNYRDLSGVNRAISGMYSTLLVSSPFQALLLKSISS